MEINKFTNDPHSGEELEEFIIQNVSQLSFEPSDWEVDTLKEVLTLPRVVVTRPPEETLLEIGMRPNDCHRNCAAQVTNDTDGRSRHVWGWYVNGSNLIFHSVVQIGGQWFCLTPQIIKARPQFEFIPDALIEWRDTSDGQGREPFRSGRKLPHALRKYPHHHIQMGETFSALMTSGMSAAEARERVDVTSGAELRKMPAI